jgi:Cu/Ag efflux protein CusF
MKKVIVILLCTVFAVVGLAAHYALANGQEKAAAAPKESRWHGVIVMIDKDKSTMDVRRENVVKTIHFDSSTKWTEAKGAKAIDMSEFKEGSEVVCLGTYKKGSVVMNATNIDLRR